MGVAQLLGRRAPRQGGRLWALATRRQEVWGVGKGKVHRRAAGRPHARRSSVGFSNKEVNIHT